MPGFNGGSGSAFGVGGSSFARLDLLELAKAVAVYDLPARVGPLIAGIL